MGFYAKCNGEEKELDSGETERERERERECVRGKAYEKDGSSASTKINRFT